MKQLLLLLSVIVIVAVAETIPRIQLRHTLRSVKSVEQPTARLRSAEQQATAERKNHTHTASLPIPVMRINNSQGQFTTVLVADSYAFFELPTGRNAALNVVVALDTFDGNCDNVMVNVKLESTMPDVDIDRPSQSDDNGDDGGSSDGGASDSIAKAVMSLLQSSIFCAPRPELGIRVKNTGDEERWYLLLEAKLNDLAYDASGEEIEHPLCAIQTFYEFEDASSLNSRIFAVSAVLLVASLGVLIRGLLVFRRPGFEMVGARYSPTSFLIGPPAFIRNCVIAAAVFIAKRVIAAVEKRRVEQTARRRREEAALLTPTAAQTPTAAGSASSNATADMPVSIPNVIVDDDENTCRICREGSDEEPLLRPCKCSGSCKFVHRSCLDRWRMEATRRNPQNASNCEICKSPFTISVSRKTLYGTIAKRCASYGLLALGAYLVIIFTAFSTRATLGELSCIAPYHTVSYTAPFGFASAALGCFCYLIGGSCVFYVAHYFYLVFRNDPEVRAMVEENHILPRFWTARMVAKVTAGCFVPLSLFIAAGYWIKIVFYETVKYGVWSWEIAPFLGLMVVTVVSVIVVAAVASRQTAPSNRPPPPQDADHRDNEENLQPHQQEEQQQRQEEVAVDVAVADRQADDGEHEHNDDQGHDDMQNGSNHPGHQAVDVRHVSSTEASPGPAQHEP